MRVDSSPLSNNISVRLPASAAATALRLGAELSARVSRDPNGQWLLELSDGTRLSADSTTPLRSGELLRLRVAAEQPTVVLQILARSGGAPLEQALRPLLARPEARQPLLETLLPLLTRAPTELPPSLAPLLQTLQRFLSRPQELADPAGLRQRVGMSGLLLEAGLASADRAAATMRLAGDLKAALLRLQRAAQSQPTLDAARELAALSERALNRIELLQLHAAQPGMLDLLVELPVQVAPQQWDLLQLRIQQEPPEPERDASAETDGGAFQVRLNFTFAGQLRFSVALRLRGERIRLTWWSEQPAVTALLRAHADELASRLRALGLEVEALECLQARGPAVDDLALLRRGGIVDEKA